MNTNEFNARMERVDALLWQTLSELLRSRFRAEAVAITLTGVKCSPDMRHAYIGYSVFDNNREVARDFFRANAGHIGKLLTGLVILKRHPKLHFQYDDSLRNMAAVDKILKEMDTPVQKSFPRTTKPKRNPAGRAGEGAPKRRSTPKRSAPRQKKSTTHD